MPAPIRSGAATPRTSIDEYSSTANAFPRRAGSVLKVSKRDAGFISPTKADFSFDDESDYAPTAITDLPDLIEEKQIARTVDRGAPGDASLMNMVKRNESSRAGEATSKRNTQYYTEVFAYREPNMTPRQQLHKFSVLTAEIKTNVIIKDEYVFLNDFSQQLSQRYQRPMSSIFITLSHSACLLFAGTFDSAYLLTITALPSAIQATTNKRNAALLQSFMTDSLGVALDRGIVHFVGIGEEYLATNGNTILGEIEALGKNSDEDNRPDTAIGRTKSRRGSVKPKDLRLRTRNNSKISVNVTSPQPSSPPLKSPSFRSPSLPAIPIQKSAPDRNAETMQTMGRRKSFFSLFGKKNA